MSPTSQLLEQRPSGHAAYVRPADLAEAIGALAADPDARPLAGGTDLMNHMRLGLRRPPLVVDLADVAALRGLESGADGLRMGARTTMRDLLRDPAVADPTSGFPALRQAADLLGGRQMQVVATVGGNLCTASPAAETATPLLVADATVTATGPDGTREIPLAELWTGPGQTCLAPGELLTAVTAAPEGGLAASAYRRIELRRSVDIALVGMSARLVVVDHRVVDARLAVSAAAPTPLLLPDAAAHLIGLAVPEDPEQPLGSAAATALRNASDAAAAAVRPIDDVRASAGYRRAMVAVLVDRVVRAAVGRPAPGRPPANSGGIGT